MGKFKLVCYKDFYSILNSPNFNKKWPTSYPKNTS